MRLRSAGISHWPSGAAHGSAVIGRRREEEAGENMHLFGRHRLTTVAKKKPAHPLSGLKLVW